MHVIEYLKKNNNLNIKIGDGIHVRDTRTFKIGDDIQCMYIYLRCHTISLKLADDRKMHSRLCTVLPDIVLRCLHDNYHRVYTTPVNTKTPLLT